MQVALPRFGNGIESVFSGNAIKTVNVAGRLKMVSKNADAAGTQIRRNIESQNAVAARAAVEKPSLLSVSA